MRGKLFLGGFRWHKVCVSRVRSANALAFNRTIVWPLAI